MAWAWDGASLDVQMGFGSPPATAIASITWTTITDYVRSLSFNYGKSDALDSYQAGRLSMVLDNRLRRFDALHTTGPYFGNLKPMTPCRLRLTFGGTTVTAWTGFVSGFPQAYDPPSDATVAVTATDGFAVLQRTRLPSLYGSEVAADAPSLWWRFGEQAGIVAADASGNHNDGVYDGGATFNSRAGLINDTDNSINFTYGMDARSLGAFTFPATNFSVEFWVDDVTAVQPTISQHFLLAYKPNDVYVGWGNGSLTAQAASSQAVATVNLENGALYHVVFVYTTSGVAPKIYVNGVNATTSSATGALTPVAGEVRVGATFFDAGGPDPTFTATIDEFAIYPTALSAARVTAHYNAGLTPYVGLDTGAVISKVLDLIGWPTADRTIETGKSTVIAFDTSGKTALEVIKAMEATEQGRFFIAPDGKATFYNRHHTLVTAASTTSQATFGDTPAELPYGDLNLEYSEDTIRNSITTSRTGGSPFNVKDAASITSYREREFSISGLYNSSDGEVRGLGDWLLGHYAQPVTRVPEIVIKPRSAPTTLFPQIRDRKLCDKVTVKRRPQNVGSAISLDVLVEGVQHNVTPDDWTTTLLLSPAEIQTYWVLDDPLLSRLDNNNRLVF